MRGTIDRVKTAQALVRREDAPVTMRLGFATCYCLEEDVRRLQTMASMTMRLEFASPYCLEEDVLRLQRRCSPGMLCIRADLCNLISTDWMRDWCKYTGTHNCRSFWICTNHQGSQ
ncbi:hypothetical protein CEXT_7301 [Caerostris extrusa]|uniref:Uncharacterized protein n=1 Tax=Caerostris extrusa TaxID=172846 RepID=A0AAV4PAY0_CAEEX|nr:hypothetical protein CEXT_7301 [Caerostris extrusa]